MEKHSLGKGKGAGGGAIVGKLAFTTEQAIQYWQSHETCILVAEETDSKSIDAMRVSEKVHIN